MTVAIPSPPSEEASGSPWGVRIAAVVIIAIAVATVAVTNRFLTERYTEVTRGQAEVRLEMYIGTLKRELDKARVTPLLLARDPALIDSLVQDQYTLTSQRLIEYRDEIGAAALLLLDPGGRVVAATERNRLGESHASSPVFFETRRAPIEETVFVHAAHDDRLSGAFWVREIRRDRRRLGYIVVEVDLRGVAENWATFTDAAMVTSSQDEVVIATEEQWAGLQREEALALLSPSNAIEQAVTGAAEFFSLPVDDYVQPQGLIEVAGDVRFQGWDLHVFTRYRSVRERVNIVLALQITVFAILLAALAYIASQKASSRVRIFQRESRELRALNDRLSQEVAERERAQADLSAAEATLEQSSKLAVLGEMSASVSHELNQPLAAMKTYLAGARLLLQRRRHDEALSSFQRIDDLIERMGAITRQLKSYARKGGEAMEPVDLRAAASSALAMMEPQLKARQVTIVRSFPPEPVVVRADRLRLEQVIINLLRNALDATSGVPEPRVELVLAAGRRASLSVRDNGHGIEDLDALFEPFYTTKGPGDGVGLGLAISSGIVSDHGGRLTARNAPGGGAVFEVRLPLLADGGEAPGVTGRGGGASPNPATRRGGAGVIEAAE